MKIQAIKEINKPSEIYNLHISNHHNYIANGLVVSNCQGIKNNLLGKLLSHELSMVPIRWAVTGTIPKEEFEVINLTCAIGKVIYKLPTIELQEKGILSHCDIKILQLSDNRSFRNYQSEYSYLTTDDDRLFYIAQLIAGIGKSGNVLVLVGLKETGRKLEKLIDGSVFLSGATKSAERKENYDKVNTSDSEILICTAGIAAVGIDVPRIKHLILLEGSKSFVRVIQSVGRALRTAWDKDHATIWDICSTCKYSKRHLRERKKYYAEQQFPFTIEKISWEK